ncbi:MAG: hypothetical protein IPN94_20865 [Sphingobacteriales bacterium]|nr:hypothetical protein [Sphingobacteriales bacterium]
MLLNLPCHNQIHTSPPFSPLHSFTTSLFHHFALSPLHPFKISPFQNFTLSQFHSFTISPLHPFTTSPFHHFAISLFHPFSFIILNLFYLQKGRILQSTGSWYLIQLEDNTEVVGRLKANQISRYQNY